MSGICISKEYGCNEATLRSFIFNNTGKKLSEWKNLKKPKILAEQKLKQQLILCPF